jgi:hypothetical protein
MAISTKYVLDKIVLASGTVISEIAQHDLTPNVEQLIERSAGVPHPQFIAGQRMRGEFSFETFQVASILTECGMTAKSLAGGNTDLYFKKMTFAGTRELAATTVHKRVRMTTGMLLWTQIQASQGQAAKATCRLVVGYDGTNLPMVEVGSLALAGSLVANQFFTLGPVKIDGTFYRGVNDLTIDSGLDVLIEDADGDLYPTFLGIKSGNPTITVVGHDMEQLEDIDFEGTPITTAVIAFLRKKLANQQNVVNGTAQHISFTGAAGQMTLESVKSGGNEGGMTTVKVVPISTNEVTWPIVVSTATAIS